jgi:hypothetical protein
MRESNGVTEDLVRTAQKAEYGNLVSILYHTEDEVYRYILHSNLGEYRLFVRPGEKIEETGLLRQSKEDLKEELLRMIEYEEVDILYINDEYISSEELLSEFI